MTCHSLTEKADAAGLFVFYPCTAFSDLDCFSDLPRSLVCFIFISLFLFGFWSRVVD